MFWYFFMWCVTKAGYNLCIWITQWPKKCIGFGGTVVPFFYHYSNLFNIFINACFASQGVDNQREIAKKNKWEKWVNNVFNQWDCACRFVSILMQCPLPARARLFHLGKSITMILLRKKTVIGGLRLGWTNETAMETKWWGGHVPQSIRYWVKCLSLSILASLTPPTPPTPIQPPSSHLSFCICTPKSEKK